MKVQKLIAWSPVTQKFYFCNENEIITSSGKGIAIHSNASHLASAIFYDSLTKLIDTQFLLNLSKFHVGEILKLF